MKHLIRIIAIVAIVALLSTVLVACKEKEADVAAQKAVNKMLVLMNGENAVVDLVDADSIEITTMNYVSFEFADDATGEKRMLYAYDIIANFTYNGNNYNNTDFYVTVLVQDGTYTTKMSSRENYELYPKKYKTKAGSLKPKQANKLVAAAVEEMRALVVANKQAADAAAAAAEIDAREREAVDAAADKVLNGVKTAYAAGSITDVTTREQLGAVVQGIDASYIVVVIDPTEEVAEEDAQSEEEQSAEQQVAQPTDGVTIYVYVPARPDTGYAAEAYALEVYTDHYVVRLSVDSTGEDVVTKGDLSGR